VTRDIEATGDREMKSVGRPQREIESPNISGSQSDIG
jgi:hypothetical protein